MKRNHLLSGELFQQCRLALPVDNLADHLAGENTITNLELVGDSVKSKSSSAASQSVKSVKPPETIPTL